jgi:segregation and condensation protein B
MRSSPSRGGVTTPGFLAHFGFDSLRDLPEIETLEDAGLLGRTSVDLLNGGALASELRRVLGLTSDEDQPEEDAA